MAKVFIDGQEGTTGLEIRERLETRSDIELLHIDAERRKDPDARRDLMHQADFVVTCLPHEAAREAGQWMQGSKARWIDPSTAHRTEPGWLYGFPELRPGYRAQIAGASRVSIPGCHATGFVAACLPLIRGGLIGTDYPMMVHSLTGYSGGGRQKIKEYEAATESMAARPYGLELNHKHLPEMQAVCGLARPPVFLPVIVNLYKGMLVSIPLHQHLLLRSVSAAEVVEVLANYYRDEPFIRVMPLGNSEVRSGTLDPTGANDTNRLDLFVLGEGERMMVVARLDNLGKGASGAAVQCLNLMLGVPEDTGLRVE